MRGWQLRLGIGSLSLLWCTAALAATPPGITISPVLSQLVLNPSTPNSSVSITVTNVTGVDLVVEARAVDFGTLDQTGGIVFLGQNSNDFSRKYGLAHWLKLSNSTLAVANGQSAQVVATVADSPDLTPGGHYGAVLITANGGDGTGSNQVTFKQILSSLVFLNKAGNETYGLRLDDISQGAKFATEQRVTLQFANTGNTHVVPRGLVELYDPLNNLVSRGSINDQSAIVLPGTSRKLLVTLLKLRHITLPGQYRMVANYRYDGTDALNTASKTLYLAGDPGVVLLTVVGVAVAIVLTIGGIWLLRRSLGSNGAAYSNRGSKSKS